MLSSMRERRWVTFGILALLVVDLVLIVAAVWPTAAPALPPVASSPSASASPSSSPSASTSPSPSPSPSPTPLAAVPLTRLVAGVDGRNAWAVDTGSCNATGTVFLTTDGGVTWTSEPAPGYVIRLRPASATSAFAVGGGSDCGFVLWSTGDGGASWSAPQSAQAAWGRTPKDPTTIERPGGTPVSPCPKKADVVDLTGVDRAQAGVLCSTGEVRETTDGGASWSTVIDRNRALALSWSGGGSGVLAETSDGCDGVVVVPVNGGKAGKSTCVEGLTPSKGQVAVSSGSGAVWLLAGDVAAHAAKVGGPWTVAEGSVG